MASPAGFKRSPLFNITLIKNFELPNTRPTRINLTNNETHKKNRSISAAVFSSNV
jgi:hypothetical protein